MKRLEPGILEPAHAPNTTRRVAERPIRERGDAHLEGEERCR